MFKARAANYRLSSLAILLGCGMLLTFATGCPTRHVDPPKSVGQYGDRPDKNLPFYLKDSVLDRCDLENTSSYRVTGWGLVIGLNGTGDSTAPMVVRDYIVKEMTKHGMGSKLMPGYENMAPEDVLADKRVAIVQVDGYIPAGARTDQRFDVTVAAVPQGYTTSLSRGTLYRTDLQVPTGNPGVNVQARVEGPVFVNPVLAISGSGADAKTLGNTARASLRSGVIMDGGIIMNDRPLVLRLLKPQMRMSRQIEDRINYYFQDRSVARAMDEGVIQLYVPTKYKGDWQHFAKVVMHLYLNPSAEFAVKRAQDLAIAAEQDEAYLDDISYAWEAFGPDALPAILPLMVSEKPDVAFAAARAAAFIGDISAQSALLSIASTRDHPFQIAAVHALGSLPNSPIVNAKLRQLLNAPETLVRIEAYKVLAANADASITSLVINEKFVLDVVTSTAPPIVYASRTGIPRIAVIGQKPRIDMPITWTAFDGNLMIASSENSSNLTLFYRGSELINGPVKVLSRPDVAEVIARLGGEGPSGEPKFNFTYGDIVGIVQSISDRRKISGTANAPEGNARMAASFVLEELPVVSDDIENAAPIESRPQGDHSLSGATDVPAGGANGRPNGNGDHNSNANAVGANH